MRGAFGERLLNLLSLIAGDLIMNVNFIFTNHDGKKWRNCEEGLENNALTQDADHKKTKVEKLTTAFLPSGTPLEVTPVSDCSKLRW